MAITLLYFTAAKREDLLRIGRVLIEERLAACVNILGEIESLYRWENAIQQETEAAAIAKTTPELTDQVIHRIQELHDYDCPAILAWPITKGNPDFFKWVNEETQ